MQHKKRGRPRLRDDREFIRSTEERQIPGQVLGAVPALDGLVHQPALSSANSHRLSEPLRALGSAAVGPDIKNNNSQLTPSPNGLHPSHGGEHGGVSVPYYNAGPNLAYQAMPVAFLNLDLVVHKSNQAFTDLVAFLGDIRGKHLGDLLEARQSESLQRLRNELRDERDEREPTYMAPITPVGQDPMRAVMESVAEQDIDQISQGFTNRPMFLSFRLPGNGQFQSLQVQIRLAKTSVYFVTLVVRSPSRSTAPPLLTQQLVPPTPLRASQAMSAPTSGSVTQSTPHPGRPPSSTSSTTGSPYFNFASVRTSLPTFSPSSYSGSPSYGYSPTAGPESSYFPTLQPLSQPATGAYPSPYSAVPRNQSITSDPLRDASRPGRLEGLQLPPIRSGPAPLGSPLHIETGQVGMQRERNNLRQRDSPSSAEQRRPETPDTGKRRRLNIHEVLE